MRFLVHRFQLRPRRRLGQNFLVDRNVARRIAEAAGLRPDERVLEVWAGLGALTLALVEQGGVVVALERDARVAEALRWVLLEWCRPPLLGRRAFVVVADVLELDLERLLAGPEQEAQAAGAAEAAGFAGPTGPARVRRPGAVAANLPYVITSPFLLQLARADGWRRAVLTVQHEVAERLAARPGTAAYGSLTVAVQARLAVQVLFRVSRRCFWPVPEVDSAVVLLEPRPDRPVGPLERALEEVLRASFGQRRKTLRNALAVLFAGAGSQGKGKGEGGPAQARQVEALLAGAGVDGGARAEQLDVDAFLRLAEAWLVCREGAPPYVSSGDSSREPSVT